MCTKYKIDSCKGSAGAMAEGVVLAGIFTSTDDGCEVGMSPM